jgi:outer membrane protein assembly factor BamB
VWTRTAALAVTAGLAASTLGGCSGDDRGDCRPVASAVVSATGPGGRSWTARTAAAEDPPSIGGGYVLLRHSCGWTALDLDDGHVVRRGDGDAVGVAGGFVYTRDEDDRSVVGELVEPGAGFGRVDRTSVTMTGGVMAYVVEDHLYVMPDDAGPLTLSQYDPGGDVVWDATLPTVREPTFAAVGSILVVTSADGSIYGLDLDDGTVLWRVLAPTLSASPLLQVRAAGDAAVVTVWDQSDASGSATVMVLDARTGERVDRAAHPDQAVPRTEASADGWRVTVDSEPVPHVMAG